MPPPNLLYLHEAIVIALINQPSRTASFDEIANFIEEREICLKSEESTPLSTQVILQFTEANDAYQHLFDNNIAGYIRLRDSYAEYPLILSKSLDAILENHRNLYRSVPEKIKVKDIKMEIFRKITLAASNIICIGTKEKSGEKKYVYVKEIDINGADTIGIYTINNNLQELKNKFDPLSHYFAQVSDSTLVNVAFFNLSGKELKTILPFEEIKELMPFKFSTSQAAKEYFRIFLIIQEAYKQRISFEKSILDWQNQHFKK